MTETQMTGLSGEDQAKKALKFVLDRIQFHPEIGWYMGPGTQTFSLVTEAAATLFERPVEEVRKAFTPRRPRNPYAEAEAPEL